jgi:hypothetical protein
MKSGGERRFREEPRLIRAEGGRRDPTFGQFRQGDMPAMAAAAPSLQLAGN